MDVQLLQLTQFVQNINRKSISKMQEKELYIINVVAIMEGVFLLQYV